MLLAHAPDEVPDQYRGFLPFILTPPPWQQKGSIPGLVRLLRAYPARDIKHIVAAQQYTAVFGIISQRLIPSKMNDSWGFELLQEVVQRLPA